MKYYDDDNDARREISLPKSFNYEEICSDKYVSSVSLEFW